MKLDLNSPEYEALLANAPLYRKSAVVSARKVTSPEHLDTVLASGLVETSRLVPVGHWIITNPGGEEYAVSEEKFLNRYESIGDGQYRAKGIIRAVKNPTGKDIEITAPWDEAQFGNSECLLASATNDDLTISKDRYIIGGIEFLDTYVRHEA